MKKDRLTTRIENALIVFKLGKTTNGKISEGKEKIVQVYSFSLAQFNYVKNQDLEGKKIDPQTFFDLADAVCFDCPFREYLKCYTHKYQQYSGFLSMIRSLVKEFAQKPPLSIDEISSDIIEMSKDRYIRFGTYGEPTLIPVGLVAQMVSVSKTHTGYTHQWRKKPEFAPYFMASVHNMAEMLRAEMQGFRSFIASKNGVDKDIAIQCPASKEAGYKSTCEKCGLCSGSMGKGRKSVQILEH